MGNNIAAGNLTRGFNIGGAGMNPMGMMGAGQNQTAMLMQMLVQYMAMMQSAQGGAGLGAMGAGLGTPGANSFYGGMPAGGLGAFNPSYGLGNIGAAGGGFPMSFPMASSAGGALGYNAAGGGGLAGLASSWNGKAFKPGQTKRCADFVSTMIKQSGSAPPGFKHEVSAQALTKYGSNVPSKDQLRPGDIVFFENTYKGAPNRISHVGIYIGDGKFVHRPTANKPVRVDSINSGRYASKYAGARRLPAAGGGAGGQAMGGAGAMGGMGGGFPAMGGMGGGFPAMGGMGGGFPAMGGMGGAPSAGGFGGAPAMGGAGMGGAGPVNSNAQIPSIGGRNPNRRQISQMLDAAAQKYGIPPNILKAVAWQESAWKADAKSFDGQHGKGVMQIDDRYHKFAKTPEVFNASKNIDYGAKFLRELYDKTGSWQKALKRYNGGSAYPPKIMAHARKQPWNKHM